MMYIHNINIFNKYLEINLRMFIPIQREQL